MARNNDGSKPRAVVLTRFSALGDVALTIPAVYDLALSHPDVTVVMVTRSWMAAMMTGRPGNLEVTGINLDEYKGVAGMARLVRELTAKYEIQAFVDLHDVLRTRLMRLFMSARGIRVSKIDKGRRDKKRLVKMGAEAFGRMLEPTSDRYRDAIERAGFSLSSHFDSLNPEVSQAITKKIYIGIAPFAAHAGKIFPLEKLRDIVIRLAENPANMIYLFGAGDSENAVLSEWARGRENVVNLAAERRGLAEEMKLMATLDLMVAMDSANMHLAAVAGTRRVVSVWGQTHPAAGFTPWHADPGDFVQLDMPCRPCSIFGNRACRFGDYPCLNDDRLQEKLFDKIMSIINAKHQRP